MSESASKAGERQSAAARKEEKNPDPQIANIDQSPPPFERVHGGDDSEFQPRSPEHQRGSIRQRQDELKFYDAIAENEKDASGNEDALKLIEEKVKEGGKQDPKFVVLLKNPWNKEETIGWGAFQVTEEAVKELMDHPAIMNVTESDKLKKMRSVKRTATTEEEKQSPAKVDKREVDWNQLQWYKDNQAEDSLMAISQWEGKPLVELLNFVYESHRGQRSNGDKIYIYVLDEGVEVDVTHLGTVKPPHYPYGLPEFPRANRERTLYTRNCILSHLNRELDEDRVEWHGTTVASAALGQMHGVAKGAHLVPVKQAGNEMVHVAEALDTAIEHITFYGLERSSVVVLPMGSALRTDPLTVIQTHLGARYMYRALDGMFNKGIPVISPAGNDRKAGRDQIDFYPGYWTANEFPLINVAETDHDGIRSEDSQAGEFVTTWAPTSPASVMYGDGTSHEESGTSIGAGYVAGVVAAAMAFEEEPWGRYTGKRRALAIRDWLKHDPHTGWTRPGGERVLWNGATEEAHQRAADDPNRLPWPTNIPDPLPPLATDQPKPSAFPIPAPPPPEPKSLQIFWNDYLKAADGKTEMYRAWYYFEGKPGQKVDPCTDDWDMRDAVLDDTVDKELDFFGPYEPDWDSPPRIEGESIMNFKFKDQKACKFQGLGDKGPSGDVGWLHCPGREAIMCLEPPEWSKGKDGWSICNEYQRYVPVAYCDWV